MIAAPSPFRQSRQERLAEAKRRQAAAREAAKNAPAAPAQSKAIEKPFDPALAALRAFGDLPDRRSSSFAAASSRPAAASFAAATRPAATRPAPVSRVPRGGRGRGGASGIRPRGGHGKGDPKRPSLGYTGARKGTGSGVYGGDLGGDRDDAFDDESEEERGRLLVQTPVGILEDGRPLPGAGSRSDRSPAPRTTHLAGSTVHRLCIRMRSRRRRWRRRRLTCARLCD
jgi:hypothetical protein